MDRPVTWGWLVLGMVGGLTVAAVLGMLALVWWLRDMWRR